MTMFLFLWDAFVLVFLASVYFVYSKSLVHHGCLYSRLLIPPLPVLVVFPMIFCMSRAQAFGYIRLSSTVC